MFHSPVMEKRTIEHPIYTAQQRPESGLSYTRTRGMFLPAQEDYHRQRMLLGKTEGNPSRSSSFSSVCYENAQTGHQGAHQSSLQQPRMSASRHTLLSIVSGILFLFFASFSGSVALASFFDHPAAISQTGTEVVSVQEGDTLTSVARRTAPTLRAEEAVAVIKDLNNLTSAQVTPGQVLIVPQTIR